MSARRDHQALFFKVSIIAEGDGSKVLLERNYEYCWYAVFCLSIIQIRVFRT